MSYLGNLSLRLAAGAMRLPEDLRRRQARFLEDRQRDDGGFAGRQGPSDLYYTGFALRGLALLGELAPETAGRAARFLRSQVNADLASADFYSLIDSAVLVELATGVDVFAAAGRDRRTEVERYLDRRWREEGGYAKTEESPHPSTYHTFLALSCRQLVGLAPVMPERTIRLIESRRREDGGFVELAPLRQSGTNPTAAAVAVLRMLDAFDESRRQEVAGFLAQMQTPEGGLRANRRIPIADLLSTFTGLIALADLNALEALDLPAAHRYVSSLEQPSGGFSGGVWDDQTDVEYGFYGLGVMALLAGQGMGVGKDE